MSPKKRQRIEIIAVHSTASSEVTPVSKREEREIHAAVKKLRKTDPAAYEIILECARKLAALRAGRVEQSDGGAA